MDHEAQHLDYEAQLPPLYPTPTSQITQYLELLASLTSPRNGTH